MARPANSHKPPKTHNPKPERLVQYSRVMRRIAAMLALAAAAAACDESAPDPEIETAARQSMLGIEGSLHSTQFMGPFQPDLRLAQLPVAEARAEALADVVESYARAVQREECLELHSDDETYVELLFEDCQFGLLGRLQIDGALRADLDLETEPCDAGTCVAAVIYDVQVSELEISGRFQAGGLVIDGGWTYRAALGGDREQELSSDVSYTGPLGNRLHIDADVSWAIDGPCVTASSEARKTVLDDTDDVLGALAVSVEGVRRCGAQCPEAGTVYLAFARGDVVTWTFTGSDVVTVQAPGGREVDVELDCAAP